MQAKSEDLTNYMTCFTRKLQINLTFNISERNCYLVIIFTFSSLFYRLATFSSYLSILFAGPVHLLFAAF